MVSDGVVVADYFRTGRTGFAYALLAMVGTNMLINLLITFVQTRGIKKGRARKVAFEVAATLTCTKPGLDAWRVSSGQEAGTLPSSQTYDSWDPCEQLLSVDSRRPREGQMVSEQLAAMPCIVT